MMSEKKEHAGFGKKYYASYLLAGDIGGTNTNLGIFGIKNNSSILLLSFHFRSQELTGLHQAINALDAIIDVAV